jgi:hypothetical protein
VLTEGAAALGEDEPLKPDPLDPVVLDAAPVEVGDG